MAGMTRKADLLSPKVRAEIEEWLERYPADRRQSAVLAALRAVQHEDGWLSREKMDAVADHIGMPEIAVYEVATFYSMFETRPVGRHTIALCTNICCMLRGADELRIHLEQKLGIKTGESTPDGRFYLKQEEECLAGCCGAPMMQVDHVYYEHLTPERVDEILDGLKDDHHD